MLDRTEIVVFPVQNFHMEFYLLNHWPTVYRLIEVLVFSVMTRYRLAGGYKCFGGKHCLHLQRKML